MTSDVLHFSLDGFFSVVRRGVKASPLHHMDWSARVAVFGLPAQVGIYLIINVSKHWHHGRIAQWISFDGTGRIVRAGICCFVSWLRPALCRRGRQSRDGFSWNNEVSDNFFISVVGGCASPLRQARLPFVDDGTPGSTCCFVIWLIGNRCWYIYNDGAGCAVSTPETEKDTDRYEIYAIYRGPWASA